jgi:hypothetical protein
MAEACKTCGVLDALDRHAPDCSRALEIGLPRLSENEEPIPPDEDFVDNEVIPVDESKIGEDIELSERVVRAGENPQEELRPMRFRRRENIQFSEKEELPPRFPALTPPGLWMSWTVDSSGYFDGTVFASELEALRHAVSNGYRVIQLELGKPVREQADGEAPPAPKRRSPRKSADD